MLQFGGVNLTQEQLSRRRRIVSEWIQCRIRLSYIRSIFVMHYADAINVGNNAVDRYDLIFSFAVVKEYHNLFRHFPSL